MYSPVSGISHRSPVKPFVHLSQKGKKKKKKKDLNINERISLYMLVANMIEKFNADLKNSHLVSKYFRVTIHRFHRLVAEC